MIWVLAGERRLKSLKQKIMNEKEMYDMCKALEDIREESRKQGEDAGKKVGMEKGKRVGVKIGKKAGLEIVTR